MAVFVQLYIKRVVTILIPKVSVEHMYKALVKLSSREGNIDLMICDPASAFKSLATDTGPIDVRDDEEAIEILSKLSNRQGEKVWERLLMSRYRHGRLNQGITVKISPTNQSHLQNQAERMVGRIKRFLSPENVFQMAGKGTITELEADTLLQILTHLVNNSPTHRLSEGFQSK